MKFKALFAMLLAVFFWGLTFAFNKNALETLSPYNYLFWRFSLTACLLLIFFFPSLKRDFSGKGCKAGLILGLSLAGTVVFQTIGLKTTPASTASFISGISVILVPLFLSIAAWSRPNIQVFFAAGMALFGMGIITLDKDFSLSMGELWILSCAGCLAVFIILAGQYSKFYRPSLLIFMQCIAVCIIAGTLAFMTETLIVPTAYEEWRAILFCIFFATLIAFYLQLTYQKFLTPEAAVIVLSCEPIFATLNAVFMLSEELTYRFYIGAAIILSSIILSEFISRQSVKQIENEMERDAGR